MALWNSGYKGQHEPSRRLARGKRRRTSPAKLHGVEQLEARQMLAGETRPNILLINTDDQRSDSLAYMPILQNELLSAGTQFENSFVTTPLCCPSRASLFTGQYAQTTGVLHIDAPWGGFQNFDDTSTLATWLDDAGYRTGLFGKYLNGYDQLSYENQDPNNTYVAPGWDVWRAFVGASYGNPRISMDGVMQQFTGAYSTDLLADMSIDFIESSEANDAEPFFLYYAPYNPHLPSLPADRHVGAFDGVALHRPPSFNEADVSDKPGFVQNSLPLLDAEGIAEVDNMRQMQLEAMLSVDEAVGHLMQTLRDTGELENTIIIYTSDNGHQWGEHRYDRKGHAWEESIRVPLVMYDGRNPVAQTVDEMALNIDLAPTIMDLAGLPIPAPVDGSSLMPLVNNQSVEWRDEFLVEVYKNLGGAYKAMRTEQFKYVEYASGDRELYDLVNDPYELVSRHNDPAFATIMADLAVRLAQLQSSDKTAPTVTQVGYSRGVNDIVTLTATVSDAATGGSEVRNAEFFIDSIGVDGNGLPMRAADGKFNSVTEGMIIELPPLSPGNHTVYVHGRDVEGNWGTYVAIVISDDTTAPVADIIDVTPDPLISVDEIVIHFSEAVNGLDLADLSLSLADGPNLLTSAQTLTTSNNATWTLNNLGALVTTDGIYTLTLTAAGSGIHDAAGNPLSAGASDTFEIHQNPPVTESLRYLALPAPATLTGSGGATVAYDDSDIAKLVVRSDGSYDYSLHFDGSDVGLSTNNEDVDAFAILPDGSLLVSTPRMYSVQTTYSSPGVGSGATLQGTGEDILKFTPASLGQNTTGVWSLYFDGSTKGLSGTDANIDALGVLPDGRLLFSFEGPVTVSGIVADDKDLLAFNPSDSSWALYFDASDVGLTLAAEDIDTLFVDASGGGNPVLYFSTRGNFGVTGLNGANDDVVRFTPTSLGATTDGSFALAFDGNLYGLDPQDITGFHIGSASQDTALPTVDIIDVDPDPRTTPVSVITIRFSEAISGIDLADLWLSVDGGPNLLSDAQSLTTADNVTWLLNNLAGLTTGSGVYTLTLIAAGSGITDATGNPLVDDAFDLWENTLPDGVLTDPVLVGAVTDASAKFFLRTNVESLVAVEYSTTPTFDQTIRSPQQSTAEASDFTSIVSVASLQADTRYYYRAVINGAPVANPAILSFVTFPPAGTAATFSLAVTADLVDTRLNPEDPAPAYASIAADDPAFMLQIGDFDHRNPQQLDSMRLMHRDVRGPNTASGADFAEHIAANMPVFHVWDDHDYGFNDGDKTFFGRNDALQAFTEYYPTPTRPNSAGIWHSFGYGQVDVFMLDLRSQRDPTSEADGPNKSMLDGDNIPNGQKQWLKAALLASTATWKIIVSSVPFNPTSKPVDGWGGYNTERTEILNYIQTNGITGVVVVSGDLHSGGAIDDGIVAGLPEISVPHTNLDVTSPASGTIGTWSVGVTEGNGGPELGGYALFRIEENQLVLEAKGADGQVRHSLALPNPAPTVTEKSYYMTLVQDGTLTSSNGATVAYDDSDVARLIVRSNGTYEYSQHFDGSDVGLSTTNEDIDSLVLLPDGSLLVSTPRAYSVQTTYASPGVGSGATLQGAGEDILKFTPASLGANTTGVWSMFFDGSANGLSGTNANIDSFALLPDGRMLFSFEGAVTVGGITADDKDLLAFQPGSGTWSMYFDGSDVGLTTTGEDIDALFVDSSGAGNPVLYFSTRANAAVTGVNAANDDILRFTPTSLGETTAGTYGLAFDGNLYGLDPQDVIGFHIGPASTDSTSPVVDISDVAPDPRNSSVSQISIQFSEPINGFSLADLTLSRAGGPNLLTGAQTLTTSDNINWTLGNLGALTLPAGDYTLTLTAATAGISDATGNPLLADATDTFTVLPTLVTETSYFLTLPTAATLTSSNGATLAYDDSDIVKLIVRSDGTYDYSLYLQGADVGLSTNNEDIDALVLLPDGSLLVSTPRFYSVQTTYASPGVGSGATLSGAGEDILKFTPTSLGTNTSGVWSLYFDGSTQGLSGNDANIDAFAQLPDGRLLFSFEGPVTVGGITADDMDLLAFQPIGSTWSTYFDASDVALTAASEDIDGLYVDASGAGNPILYFSTRGNFAVTGLSGASQDIFRFTPTTLGATTSGVFSTPLTLDGSLFGLGANNIAGMFIGNPAATFSQLAAGFSANLASTSLGIQDSPTEVQTALVFDAALAEPPAATTKSAPKRIDPLAADLLYAAYAPAQSEADLPATIAKRRKLV